MLFTHDIEKNQHSIPIEFIEGKRPVLHRLRHALLLLQLNLYIEEEKTSVTLHI